jgi:hypothetical protein
VSLQVNWHKIKKYFKSFDNFMASFLFETRLRGVSLYLFLYFDTVIHGLITKASGGQQEVLRWMEENQHCTVASDIEEHGARKV